MLKKSDLAKQFELVVQQEIQNYNKSLSQIFSKLQSLQDQVTEVRENLHDELASLHSKHALLVSSINILTDAHLKHVQAVDSSFNDQDVSNKHIAGRVGQIQGAVDLKIKVDSNWKENIKNVHDQMEKWGQHYHMSNVGLHNRIDELLGKFRKEIQTTKQEILEAPTEISTVKTELQEQLNSYKIDVSGIMREINIFKKEAYIVEKKLEHILTEIQGLKGDK